MRSCFASRKKKLGPPSSRLASCYFLKRSSCATACDFFLLLLHGVSFELRFGRYAIFPALRFAQNVRSITDWIRFLRPLIEFFSFSIYVATSSDDVLKMYGVA